MENMELWNKVFTSDKEHVKQVSFGRKFHTVGAYSQLKKATELWGPFGGNWGIRDERFSPMHENMILYTATLYYPGDVKKGEQMSYMMQLHADIKIIDAKNRYNEDWSKKVATDALTKGLSKLGFNGDIFMGLWHDNKYVQQLKTDKAPVVDKLEEAKTKTIDYMNNHIRELGIHSETDRGFKAARIREKSTIDKVREIYKEMKDTVDQLKDALV